MSEYLTDKQVEDCKYMLEHQVYYHSDKSGYKNDGDDLILVKYLQELGYNKDDTLKVWQPIYESAYGKCTDDKIHWSLLFSAIWDKANAFPKKSVKVTYVYQNELDAINNMICSKWMKELLLTVLVKTKSKNKYEYHEPLINKLVKFTSISRRDVEVYQLALKCFEDNGFLKCELEDWYDKTDGETYKIDKYTWYFPKPTGDPIFSVTQDQDVVKYFNLITMLKTCKECGQQFVYTMNTKRDVCLDCWRHNETIKRENRRKKQLIM